jgi:hypothetical protein
MATKTPRSEPEEAAEFDFSDVPMLPAEATEELMSFSAIMAEGDVYDASSVTGETYQRLDRNQKRQLVGVPFIIEDHEIREGDQGLYSIVRLVTQRNERYSFTDGGMGITQALDKVEGGTKLLCKTGLRASDYEVEVDGVKRKATTYYLG